MEARETEARVQAVGLRVRNAFSRRWPPRVLQMVLAFLLFLSAFLFRHDSFGVARAWIGGLVIAAGFGYTAPAAAGALLAAAGLVILTCSVLLQRKEVDA